MVTSNISTKVCAFYFSQHSSLIVLPQKILEIIISVFYCTRQNLSRKRWKISQHDTKVFQVPWLNLSQTEKISSAGVRARWTRLGKPLRAPCLRTTSLSDKKAAASRNSPSSSPPHLHLHNFIFLILFWYRSDGIQIKNHRSITGPSLLCNTNFSIN